MLTDNRRQRCEHKNTRATSPKGNYWKAGEILGTVKVGVGLEAHRTWVEEVQTQGLEEGSALPEYEPSHHPASLAHPAPVRQTRRSASTTGSGPPVARPVPEAGSVQSYPLEMRQFGTIMVTSLDALMSAVLAQLELASHIAAANSDSGKVSHGKNGGTQPPPVSASHLHYRERFDQCRSDASRRAVIAEALKELRSIRYAKRGGHRDTVEGRLTIGRDQRPVRIVAEVFGYSVAHIYKLRAEAKRVDAKSVRQRTRIFA